MSLKWSHSYLDKFEMILIFSTPVLGNPSLTKMRSKLAQYYVTD